MKFCENETLENSDSNSAPVLEKNVLTEEQKKDEINKNYLPNLSEYQQISYDINTEKGESKAFYPNVNYQDESRKGYYIFYNNNLIGLKEFYSYELTKLKDNNPFVLLHIKEFLDKLDSMTEQAFDDQCTGANPRYPLMSEIKQMYLNAYYGENKTV